MDGIKTYKEWQEFSQGYEKVSVFMTAEDIFHQTPWEKELSAEQKVRNMFLEKGIEITRYRHDYKTKRDKDYWGLVFHRTDSDILERMEITAIVGVNARRIHAAEVTTTSNDSGS